MPDTNISIQKSTTGTETDYRSATYSARGSGDTENPRTVCATCPAAIWYDTDQLRCFCDVMKSITFSTSSTPVTACDGRELAIARLEKDMK
jgi:hypothetical protein